MRHIAIAFAVLTSGCASIVNDPMTPVHVDAIDANGSHVSARCDFQNGKGAWSGTSSGSTMVHRSVSDMAVNCATEGPPRQAGSFTVASSGSGWLWGNILFGGLIGLAVDAGTGDGWGYPPSVTVPMQRIDAPMVPLTGQR